MNTPKWAALTEDLTNDPEPKARENACKKLVATRDPAVIPFLRKAYFEDQDERVRESAREGLARFKSQQAGQSVRRLPLSDRTLSLILGGLAALLVVTLVLNGLTMLGGDDDDKPSTQQSDIFVPTDRTLLIGQIEERFAQTQTLTENLRAIVNNYNTTGQTICDPAYQVPPALAISEMDRKTYPDLRLVAEKFDATLLPLSKALGLINQACIDPSKETTNVLEASATLDQVDNQLEEVNTLLQTAIMSPAATVGPTVTPLPTWTFTPTPITPTATPTATLPVTVTATPTLTLTPVDSPTPVDTPTPIPTLPLPNLDYQQILRDLSQRYIVIGDLTNRPGTGMLDQWRKAQTGAATSTTACSLDAWPSVFGLTAEQEAVLNAPGVADPLLGRAIQLQAEGLNQAYQARTLYERDCFGGALANSAAEGVALAEGALSKLEEAKRLTEEMRARSTENQ